MNVNKIIIKTTSFIALAAAMAMGSCTKSFVNKLPLGSIVTSDSLILNDAASIQSAINGVYADLRNVDQYGRDWPIIGDLMADNIYVD